MIIKLGVILILIVVVQLYLIGFGFIDMGERSDISIFFAISIELFSGVMMIAEAENLEKIIKSNSDE
jgi:hypothetical protein